MRKYAYGKILPMMVIPGMAVILLAWGFKGHQQINHMAVFGLPPELFGFFKNNIAFVTDHAVDADKRRYAVPDEAPRHFIDLDRYGEHPFDSLPHKWEDAVLKYGEDSLKAHGIVPWHIMVMLRRLTYAFKEKNNEKILRYAADLGHYIGDAHVPLHCTRNYNGQLTNQHGIHGLWESRLPELFSDDYDKITGRAVYVKNPEDLVWNVLRESYAAKDSVLLIEKHLNDSIPPDQKFAFEDRGGRLVKVYSKNFSTAYHRSLNGMVERRMRSAIFVVSSFWYTAWVDAGMPELQMNDKFRLSGAALAEMDSLERSYSVRTGELHGHDD